MFPRPEKPDLSIFTIADYWSREDRRATERELRQTMIGAWWDGKLESAEATKRVDALRVLHGQGGNGWVAFLVPGSQHPSEIVEQASGGAVVDRRVRVPLPEGKPDSWTEESCTEAFQALASGWTEDMSHELFIGLLSMNISREAFMDWTNRSGYLRPNFWGQRKPIAPVRRQSESDARAFVERYVDGEKAAGRRPTQVGLEDAEKKEEKHISRAVLRRLFKQNRDAAGVTIRRGRPSG